MKTESEVNAIETKELRGLNLRNLIGIVICTASVVTTYFSVKSAIDDVKIEVREIKNERSSEKKYDDLRFQILEIRTTANESQVKELSSKYEDMLKSRKSN